MRFFSTKRLVAIVDLFELVLGLPDLLVGQDLQRKCNWLCRIRTVPLSVES